MSNLESSTTTTLKWASLSASLMFLIGFFAIIGAGLATPATAAESDCEAYSNEDAVSSGEAYAYLVDSGLQITHKCAGWLVAESLATDSLAPVTSEEYVVHAFTMSDVEGYPGTLAIQCIPSLAPVVSMILPYGLDGLDPLTSRELQKRSFVLQFDDTALDKEFVISPYGDDKKPGALLNRFLPVGSELASYLMKSAELGVEVVSFDGQSRNHVHSLMGFSAAWNQACF